MSDGAHRREIVEAYAAASARHDLAELARLRHPEWAVDWPQSGERVQGSEHFARIIEGYPGGVPKVEVTRIVGGEDRWVLTPGNTVIRVDGSGDFWWGEWTMTYPDGDAYHVVDLLELRGGLVYRERVYWAPPFEAPDWRRPFVELPPA
ncbi:MAG: nuclear transport factor 2 family protein [Chloroflexi bacterium]|nr:nuclear transport factor 2 family protein [Chloroflexota bacterium]